MGRKFVARDTDVQYYLKEISLYKLLSAEEEQELARRIRKGDKEARDIMVRANLRLVVSIAKNFVGRGLSFLDLIEEGNIGLLKAVERFDPDYGYKFSTYACWWIKQSMRRSLTSRVKNVRIPAYMAELLLKWRKMTQDLRQKLEREPSMEEIAQAIGVSAKKIPAITRALIAQGPKSSDTVLVTDVPDPHTANNAAEDIAYDRMDGRSIHEILNSVLSERENLIVRLRFGIDEDTESLSLGDIGDRLGLTRERIRQIEARALYKLFSVLSGKDEATSEPKKKKSRRKKKKQKVTEASGKKKAKKTKAKKKAKTSKKKSAKKKKALSKKKKKT